MRKAGEAVAEVVYGKKSAQAFFRVEISARELMKRGRPLSKQEFDQIEKEMAEAGFGRTPLKSDATKSNRQKQ